MKTLMKLLTVCLLFAAIILVFPFDDENNINKLYILNEQGNITIKDAEFFQYILERKFKEEGMDIKFDSIIAEKQILKNSIIERVFTLPSPNLHENISIRASAFLNGSDVDFWCTSFNCKGCEPIVINGIFHCTDCNPRIGLGICIHS